MADLISKINRVATNVKNSLSEVTNKGVTVPADANSDNLPALIAAIESGTELTLIVTTKSGATVTATKGDLSVSGVADSSGVCVLAVPEDGTWTLIATLNGETSLEGIATLNAADEKSLFFVSRTLNNNDWGDISEVAASGNAANLWSIGDRKAVTLNGTVGKVPFSNITVYAFIIGFDHNAEREGFGRIHFQLAKSGLTSGGDLAFCDTNQGKAVSVVGYFSMNAGSTNSGGWKSSQMRTNICGTSLTSYAGTLLGAIPAALRNVIKPITKYTNNVGDDISEGAVTATTDYFFCLAEYEVYGTCTYANSNEAKYQKQYAYYSAGNSLVKYNHLSPTEAVFWWLRSPWTLSATHFVRVNAAGAVFYTNANESRGFAPGFCV